MATFGIASVIGPLVGGLFAGADTILWVDGWRWVFLVNVPVGAIALLMVISFMHLPHHHSGHPHRLVGRHPGGRHPGPAAAGRRAGPRVGLELGAVHRVLRDRCVGLLAFILVERAMGSDAIIPLRLLSRPASRSPPC